MITTIPDVALAGTSLFALLRADRCLLLDLTENGGLVKYARPGLHVHVADPLRSPAHFTEVRAVLIRPDGHIAWAGTDGDDAALAEGLRAALTFTRRL
ncbi:aromatic-ring hydroxylase C-terminal domain-containing protein [Streptomyces sp. NPDC004976]